MEYILLLVISVFVEDTVTCLLSLPFPNQIFARFCHAVSRALSSLIPGSWLMTLYRIVT